MSDTPSYITTGDQRWNPKAQRWEPIDSPLPNYHPTGGDPLEGAGAVLVPPEETRARLAAAAASFGAALPPAAPGGQQQSKTADPAQALDPDVLEGVVPGTNVAAVVSLGGTRHVIEGAEPLSSSHGLIDAPLADPSSDERITELEQPKHDTERPPRRRR